jgi:hypothetical protein
MYVIFDRVKLSISLRAFFFLKIPVLCPKLSDIKLC